MTTATRDGYGAFDLAVLLIVVLASFILLVVINSTPPLVGALFLAAFVVASTCAIPVFIPLSRTPRDHPMPDQPDEIVLPDAPDIDLSRYSEHLGDDANETHFIDMGGSLPRIVEHATGLVKFHLDANHDPVNFPGAYPAKPSPTPPAESAGFVPQPGEFRMGGHVSNPGDE